MNVNLVSDTVEANIHLPNLFSPTICSTITKSIHPSIGFSPTLLCNRLLLHAIFHKTNRTYHTWITYLYLSKKLNNFGFQHRAAESTFETSLYFLSRAKTKKTNIKTTVHFKLQNKQYLNVTNRAR